MIKKVKITISNGYTEEPIIFFLSWEDYKNLHKNVIEPIVTQALTTEAAANVLSHILNAQVTIEELAE